MQKLDSNTDGASKDIVVENVSKLKSLFPEVFSEGKIDFDVLREVLGDYIEDREERYSFTWHGKSRARRIAQTPSTGTLRPCPEESVNWDTTQNLFIEGDNLEVLKLLQKSYHKKVKMIYIDPPYNTGKEFIYPDKFQDNLETYLRYTGQVDDEGFKMSANAETSGRYHTNWLNMMYPRLRLARNLLRDDGVIFISIDDHEVANLRKMCDEVFGEENFVACFIWRSRPSEDSRSLTGVSQDHEYILAFAKSQAGRLRGTLKDLTKFANPDGDPRGPWRSADLTGLATAGQRPNLHYDLVNPATGINYGCPPKGWRYDQATMAMKIKEQRILWPETPQGRPRHKLFQNEMASIFKNTSTVLNTSSTLAGTRLVREIFEVDIFDFPKPLDLIRFLVEQGTEAGSIVLDFFAGSCTTAHGVLDLNLADGKDRRFIMVQLPEPCEDRSEARKAGYATIADIGKERIRRVIKKIEAEREEAAQKSEQQLPGTAEEVSELDLGFKVFKLDSSNIKPWDPDFDDLEGTLFNAVDNIKSDRTEADVLYELLLKQGLDLAIPIEERHIEGQKVYVIGGGALVVCLDDDIDLPVAEGIAALKAELEPEVMHVIFKDAGFQDDVVKTNTVQILQRAGVDKVVSV